MVKGTWKQPHKYRHFLCEITKTVSTLTEIFLALYSCFQGEAESRREPADGGKRSSWSLCWDHGSTHQLSHVVLVGQESGSLHISQIHALNNLITWIKFKGHSLTLCLWWLQLFTFLICTQTPRKTACCCLCVLHHSKAYRVNRAHVHAALLFCSS